MERSQILEAISKGRTDYIVQLLKLDDWESLLVVGNVKVAQWLVYYNDITALRMIVEKKGNLSEIDLGEELGNAAFFGHWKVCDFLINQGADVNYKVAQTLETPLHNALSKAGRPYYIHAVRLLIEKGANVNAKTAPNVETGAFMRDVRTKGETPLHRAAAFADENTLKLLIAVGADIRAKDISGDSPLSWASMHLRPGRILQLLQYDEHRVSEAHAMRNTSDHGNTWGNGMDWNLMGDYLPE